jgi:class 3 adenylate cyclase
MHIGRPRKLGGDYLGVDVNIAARLAEKAAPGELLVSDRALADLDASALKIVRKRRFHVKGVPKDVQTFSVAVRR